MQPLLTKLKKDFPKIAFESGQTFCWSPKNKKVVFKTTDASDQVAFWALLHEVGHALLDHNEYESDFQLLQLEVAAWQKAKDLAPVYGYEIDNDHVEDCLDTYRDWLYRRSLCPTCRNCSLQINKRTYCCFNCETTWHVSASKLCRPYRRTVNRKQHTVHS